MTKKIFLAIALVSSLLLCNSNVFAMNNVRDGMNNAGNQVENSWEKMGNSIKNVGNSVTNGVSTMMGTNNNYNTNTNNDGQYTARRTATEGTIFGMNGTMWTWFVMAILGIVLISLVWYYGMQKSNTDSNTNTGKHE